MELTAEQFSKLSKLIYKKLGLQFDEKKTYFLNKRVEQRIAELGLKDADEYLFQLGYCDANGDEMQALANLITTNETYMFREFEQLAGFADVCLPELIAAKQKTTDRRIRLWCAGCSSGEEAYTLAIIIREVFPDSRNWDIKIVATDIDRLQQTSHTVGHWLPHQSGNRKPGARRKTKSARREADEGDARVRFRVLQKRPDLLR
jgi:chemotaxis protein methyltransferase CheR